jgi:glycosyltransferase 2 family protein
VTLTLSAGVVAPLVAIPLVSLLLTWLPILLGAALLLFPVALRLLSRRKWSLTSGAYLLGALLQGVYWCVIGLAFTAYISAFDGLALAVSTLETAAIYLFSWCLGYLALFAPQGIGVAEFISGNLLRAGGAAELVAFLVGFRLLVLVADLLSWGLAAAIKTLSAGRASNPLGADRQ